MEIKQEITDFEDYTYKQEMESEEEEDKTKEVEQWDSDSTVINSDVEMEKDGENRQQYSVDVGAVYNKLAEPGIGSLEDENWPCI
uniref:Uncharacterized protein n=1 Tax=Arion vulgaris TaxID=1028688 RepID=A0A0B6ZEH3_9EUPU